MIAVLGPLTDLALAATISPEILMRAKSIVVMGGAVSGPGNITPLAEFNFYADPIAAARIFALTSRDPSSTMPISPLGNKTPSTLRPYPPQKELGLQRLQVLLFPLDLAQQHIIRRGEFEAKVKARIANGSPLAEWTNAFMSPIFEKLGVFQQEQSQSDVRCYMPDPLCAWYTITNKSAIDEWKFSRHEDIRIETSGQWARGACCVDRRGWPKRDDPKAFPADEGRWLNTTGNQIHRCIGTPGAEVFASFMLDTIFGAD